MRHFMSSRSLVWSLGLASASLSFGQQTATTQEIEGFFDHRAESLQKHLSVPLADQAFYKRFNEAYSPLEAGKIPAQWKDALVQRLLALAAANTNLTDEQRAQINAALDTLGSADSSSAASAAALASLSGALGISTGEAADALSNAASDSGLFNGNTSISRSFMQNTQAGFDASIAQSGNPNSLQMARIVPPDQMKYDSEGAVVGVVASKAPNPGALTMGSYASQLGQGGGVLASKGNSGGNTTSPFSKKVHAPGAEAPALSPTSSALSSLQGALAPKTTTASSGTNSFKASDHDSSTFTNSALLNKANTHPTTKTPPSAEADADPFKFDPQVLLGGDYYDQYRQKISSVTQSPSTSAPGSTGSLGGGNAGSSVASSAMKQKLVEMGDRCEDELYKMYGYTKGKVPENLSFDQVTEMWRTFAKNKQNMRADLLERQRLEAQKSGTNPEKPTYIGAIENLALPNWNPLSSSDVPAEAINTKAITEKIEASKDKQGAFNDTVDDLLSHFSAQLNGLANTDQDACILTGKQMGNPSPGECGKEFAISSKDGTFRNSPLTNHVKIMALLDAIRELNAPEAVSINTFLTKNYAEQYTKRFPDRKPGASLTRTILMRDDKPPESANSKEVKVQPGSKPKRSFRLQEYLFDCADPGTSWMAKIQDLEVLARKSLLKSCAPQAEVLIMRNAAFVDTSTPLFPATSDLCTFKGDIKTIYKAPTAKSYPDFFGTQKTLSETECETLLATHGSLAEILETGRKRCQFLHDRNLEKSPQNSNHNGAQQ